MSTEECLTANWQAIGYEDGAQGAPISAITSRRQACARKAGITVNMAAYLTGRDMGLVEFCQPDSGYALGVRGGTYHGVCNGPEERDFIVAYEAGRQLYSLENAVASAEDAIRRAHRDLHRVEDKIAHTQVGLVSPDTTIEDRLLLLADLKHFSEEKGNIETAIIALSRDHQAAQDELAEYRRFVALNGPYPNAVTGPSYANFE